MAKSSRKKAIVWTTSILVVLGVLVIGDRVAASIAGDQLSQVIAKQATANDVKSAKPPTVTMGGFPFLTQVIAGEYSRIDIELVEVGNDTITLPKLDIVAHDVEASMSTAMGGSGPVKAKRMEAEADIAYTSLTESLDNTSDSKITARDDKTLEIRLTMDIAGQRLNVVGAATVEITDDKLVIQAQQFGPEEGQLPPGGDQIMSELAQSFSKAIPLPSMPFDLKLGQPRFEDDHIAVSATAEDVPLSG